MSELSTKFEKIVKAIDDTITDFTTLDVITVGGNLKLMIKDGKFMKPLEFMIEFDPTKQDIRIDAFTHVDFDQDVIQFYRDGITEEDLNYKLHQQAVESSKAARLAVLTFIKEVLK